MSVETVVANGRNSAKCEGIIRGPVIPRSNSKRNQGRRWVSAKQGEQSQYLYPYYLVLAPLVVGLVQSY